MLVIDKRLSPLSNLMRIADQTCGWLRMRGEDHVLWQVRPPSL